jgi:hypothetical protein
MMNIAEFAEFLCFYYVTCTVIISNYVFNKR